MVILFIIIFSVVSAFSISIDEPDTIPDSSDNDDKPVATLHEVLRVIDGDTIEIMYFEKAEKVRLIGINAPETSPKECYGAEATQLLQELLPVGAEVAVQFDETQDERDRYQRLLLYVWNDEDFINEQMISSGAAFEYTYDKTYLYSLDFKAAERQAEIENLGVWGENCACDQEVQQKCSGCESAEITTVNWDCTVTTESIRDNSCIQGCN